jgi:hypothetical protein
MGQVVHKLTDGLKRVGLCVHVHKVPTFGETHSI